MTCPGLGTLPEARHVVRKTLRAGPVVDDSRTAFALRKSPVDDEFAERTSLRLHVSVTIAGDIAITATVEHVSRTRRTVHSCASAVKLTRLSGRTTTLLRAARPAIVRRRRGRNMRTPDVLPVGFDGENTSTGRGNDLPRIEICVRTEHIALLNRSTQVGRLRCHLNHSP